MRIILAEINAYAYFDKTCNSKLRTLMATFQALARLYKKQALYKWYKVLLRPKGTIDENEQLALFTYHSKVKARVFSVFAQMLHDR